ncbi:MAG: ComEC/Rec2 family competence protein, partial [Prevotella sp.]|nr:ComEC/Rec2 family competence protein [Prevotella sp.]
SRFERLRLKALVLRQQLLTRYRLLGLDDQQLAVVAAMTLGDKSMVSQTTRNDYSVSGASHVLALSGLHLGIIYALLTLLLGRSRRWRWLSQGVVLMAIWMYVVLVGLPPSAIRSATMLTLCSVCIVVGRQQVSVNTLAFAALVMLVSHPLNLWDVGFQMSFMAVLAILVYHRPLYHLLTPQNPLVRWSWGLAVVSVSAQIGTAPLVIYYFGRFSCYFLLTNFVVIPVATLILYGAVAMLLCAPFLALQRVVASLLLHLAALLNTSLAAFARLPGASIEGIHINTLQLYLIYIVILSLTVLASYALKIKSQKDLEAFYN